MSLYYTSPNKVMGFNTYKTTVPMPNNTKALVLHPTAMLFATGQHAPNDTSKNMVEFIPSTNNGITVTGKIFYDAYKAQTVYLLECLFGVTKGNPLALYQMK